MFKSIAKICGKVILLFAGIAIGVGLTLIVVVYARNEKVVAYVGEQPIKYVDVKAYEDMNFYSSMMQFIRNQTIIQSLEAVDESVRVTNDDVKNRVQAYKDKCGGQEAYEESIELGGQSVKQYEYSVYQQLLTEKAIKAMQNKIPVPSKGELSAYIDGIEKDDTTALDLIEYKVTCIDKDKIQKDSNGDIDVAKTVNNISFNGVESIKELGYKVSEINVSELIDNTYAVGKDDGTGKVNVYKLISVENSIENDEYREKIEDMYTLSLADSRVSSLIDECTSQIDVQVLDYIY